MSTHRRYVIYDVEHDMYLVNGGFAKIPRQLKLYTKAMATKRCDEQRAKGYICDIYCVDSVINNLNQEIKEIYKGIIKGTLTLDAYMMVRKKTSQVLELQFTQLKEKTGKQKN